MGDRDREVEAGRGAATGRPAAEKPGRLATAWSTACTFLFAVPMTIVTSVLSFLFAWLPPRGRASFAVARWWGRSLLFVAGLRLETEIDPAVEPEASYVFLANHQSYLDIPAILAVVPGQLRFAAKRSLFRIPVFGWALWAMGFVPVDRDGGVKARRAFEAAVVRLREGGSSMLFFPEGTRSHDGRLAELKRGGVLLAIKSGLPIIPVGISGAWDVLPRHRLTVRPGTIRLRFGPPIATEGLGVRDLKPLTARVREEILRLSGEEP